jgi:hypothetical protein
MADSDEEYVHNNSSADEDDHDLEEPSDFGRRQASGSSRQRDRLRRGQPSKVSRGKERARWEGSLQERNAREFGGGGAVRSVEELNRASEARKRAR